MECTGAGRKNKKSFSFTMMEEESIIPSHFAIEGGRREEQNGWEGGDKAGKALELLSQSVSGETRALTSCKREGKRGSKTQTGANRPIT